MIILFHIFVMKMNELIPNKRSRLNNEQLEYKVLDTDEHLVAEEDEEIGMKFNPPVSKQRYKKVVSVLLNEKWTDKVHKVLDIGCGKFNLFNYIKYIESINELLLVDVDADLLETNLYKINPILYDYMKRRKTPLSINVFCGSVAHPDCRLLDTDMVIAIELIEHLFPDVLEALPYNLFSYIHPKIIAITTPNADFNILFKNFKGFRNSDHKFEWSREQFESWAMNIVSRFPNYTVSFFGIGCGPKGTEAFGCCSQMAVFKRNDLINDNFELDYNSCSCIDEICKNQFSQENLLLCFCNCKNCAPNFSYGICTFNSYSKTTKPINANMAGKHYFEQIKRIDYPVAIVDVRSQEQKLEDAIKYRVYNLSSPDGQFFNLDENRAEIPLELIRDLIKTFDNIECSTTELREFLIKLGYKITVCLTQKSNLEDYIIYEEDMNNSSNVSSQSSDSESSIDEDKYKREVNNETSEEEDWSINTNQNNDITIVESYTENETNKNEILSNNVENKEEKFYSDFSKSVVNNMPEEDSVNTTSATPSNNENKRFDKIKLEKFNVNSAAFDKLESYHIEKIGSVFTKYPFNNNEIHGIIHVENSLAGPSNNLLSSDGVFDDVQMTTMCILENTLNQIDTLIRPNEIIESLAQPLEPPETSPAIDVSNISDEESNNSQSSIKSILNNIMNNLEANGDNLFYGREQEENNDQIVRTTSFHTEENDEVARSSREALYDSNSHIDLLEDFDVISMPERHPNSVSVLVHDNEFPNWLLSMFANNDQPVVEENNADFFSQGDGIVMTIAVNDDAEDEESSTTEDSEDSVDTSEHSAEYNLERGNARLDVHELLNEEDVVNLMVIGQSIENRNENNQAHEQNESENNISNPPTEK